MIRLMIRWPLSSVRLIAAMRNLAGLSGTMSFLLGGGKAASVMATKGSVFVDTSGWAYLVDRSAELHHSVHAVYQQIVAQRRLLVTTNSIIAELLALLPSRPPIPRHQIVISIYPTKPAPPAD